MWNLHFVPSNDQLHWIPAYAGMTDEAVTEIYLLRHSHLPLDPRQLRHSHLPLDAYQHRHSRERGNPDKLKCHDQANSRLERVVQVFAYLVTTKRWIVVQIKFYCAITYTTINNSVACSNDCPKTQASSHNFRTVTHTDSLKQAQTLSTEWIQSARYWSHVRCKNGDSTHGLSELFCNYSA